MIMKFFLKESRRSGPLVILQKATTSLLDLGYSGYLSSLFELCLDLNVQGQLSMMFFSELLSNECF